MEIAQPDEVYNLSAISFVGLSWNQPELTGDITGMGVLRMFEAIHIHTQGSMDGVRFYQASSSEMFGTAHEAPQRETTRFHPRSPYGVAKVFGHYVTQKSPRDYVIATGKTHSVRDLLDIAFHHVSISDWEPYVVQDSRFMRPADVDIPVRDARSLHGPGGSAGTQQPCVRSE